MSIIQDNGRWRSIRTRDERKKIAAKQANSLNEREQIMLRKILDQWQQTGRSQIVDEVSKIEWEENPVPVREWLMNEELVGETGKDMYPQLRDDMAELFEGDYHEAILTGAIGWGKDFFATTACMRMLYELNCLKNPQHTLGLAEGEPIHIVPISRTVAAARRVVFGGICKKLALSKWFLGKYEETMEEIRFRKKGIYIVGGASQDAAALGLNVIFAIVDECVTADTQILTPDGYFPVSDLHDSSKNDGLTYGPIVVYNEKTGEGQVDAGFIRPASVAEVFEVEFDDGRTIKVTERHPFLVRRPWSDLDYVFLKDLKPGDEVIVVDPARPEWGKQPILREDAHAGGQGQDGRGDASPSDGHEEVTRDAREDQTREHQDEGEEGRDSGGRSAGRGTGSLRDGRAREAETADRPLGVERAAGWRVASHEEALVGSSLPGPDDRYQASLLSQPGVEGEDRGSEHEAEGSVQALRGDEAEDQQELGLESEEGRLHLPGLGGDEEGSAEAWSDEDRLPVEVGAASDAALGRMLVRSQFPVRTAGRSLHLGGEAAVHDPRLPGDDDGRVDRDGGDQAARLHLQREGTSQGRRLLAVLHALGLEVRSVGRATSVARVVAVRSAGRHQTYDVMSLPGGNFVANGLVVHNTNFMGEGKVATGSASAKAEDKATMIYNALARRVKARYKRHGVKGLIMLVSSKRSTNDFTERRIRTAAEDDDEGVGVFVRDYAIWNVHPEPYRGQKWYRVSVNSKEGRCKLLEKEDEEALPGSLIFKIPEDYLSEFRNDPDGATRDIAGIATDFVGRLFITRRPAIDQMFDRRRLNLFRQPEWTTHQTLQVNWAKLMTRNANDEPIPICCQTANRHAHIDMATTQCACGLVTGHVAGTTEVWRRNPETNERVLENAPVIHVDGVLRALAPDGGDIDHGEVRGVIYQCISGGMPIRSVSMDQYMSPPNLQMFKRRGLKTEEVGERVARMKPYLMLRQAIYEQRIICPYHPVLDKELKELEIGEDGKKIKHPPKGSKDLADALAGLVYYLTEHGKTGDPLGPMRGQMVIDSPGAGPQWSNGEVLWPDEDEDAIEGRRYDPTGGEFNSWIVI